MMADNYDFMVRQAVEGDNNALTALLAKCGPAVRTRLKISRAFRSSVDADDVMQVSYLEVFLRVKELRARDFDRFTAWVGRIAENNLRDAIRELERAKRPSPHRRVAPSKPEESVSMLLEQIGMTSAGGSRQASGRESNVLLDQAVRRLPESYQNVIRLHYYGALDVPDIADKLNKSRGAIYMLIARAQEQLREALGNTSNFFS